ncbi:hypothetical protein [Salarchaeum sp. JOR-1]|uniref:hypothetical protein n=1 Tax=Salarchaeum sp. JOR-1 TaxID=2599399 RepID=UPI001198C605|nr:hypothetical protein [Salarchaeum sp. JOR-1]QDX40135.1 hypothetical protein FQU85_04225 [Salarchaeum sp. JOR-1]
MTLLPSRSTLRAAAFVVLGTAGFAVSFTMTGQWIRWHMMGSRHSFSLQNGVLAALFTGLFALLALVGGIAIARRR